MKAFRSKFPTANLWAGAPWFEEDCDAALVVAAFPDLFSAGAVANAMRMISGRSDIKVEEPKQ
jgi:hypothetical protein